MSLRARCRSFIKTKVHLPPDIGTISRIWLLWHLTWFLLKTFKLFGLPNFWPSVHDESYTWNILRIKLNIWNIFHSYNPIDTYVYGLLALRSIIHPVVSPTVLTWFIRSTYVWNWQFLYNVILLKLKQIFFRHRWHLMI